ncbi:MAG: SAM-dependent chlorinase/fluorinase [Bacteroidota bacterium]
MAILTFLSDFGRSDHYVAAVKAKVLSINPGIQIVDLSHEITPHDIGHGAYLLGSVFRDFPSGTVHLACLSAVGKRPEPAIAIRLEEQYFVGNDSGLFSLLSDRKPDIAVELTVPQSPSTYLEKDQLAVAAAKLASGDNMHEMGSPYPELQRLIGRQVKANKKQIIGHVIRVDHYGNLITNIPKSDFDNILKLNGTGKFEVKVGREKLRKVHESFNETEGGEIYLLFNSNDRLQVGIKNGKATELLGLGHDAPIIIDFLE